MKTTARRLKLTHYELRVLIDARGAKRLKQRANVIDNRAISNAVHFIVKRCTTNLNVFWLSASEFLLNVLATCEKICYNCTN